MLSPFPCLPPSPSILLLSLRQKTKRGGVEGGTPPRCRPIRSALPPEKADIFRLTESLTSLFFLFFKEIQRDVARVSALLLNKLHDFLTYVKSCANTPCLCLHCAWVSVVQLRTCAWWDLEDILPTIALRTSPLWRRHCLSRAHPSLGRPHWVVKKQRQGSYQLSCLGRFCKIVDLLS